MRQSDASSASPPPLVERASGRLEVDSLRARADLLASVRHPGVAELLEFTVDGDTAELTTAGGAPLAERLPLPPEEVAGLAAALATTLADLHAEGVVHGSVDIGHVVLDGAGRPLLHGFERGRRVSPAPAPGFVPAPESDVAGLGGLVLDALGLPAGGGEPWDDLRARLASRPATSFLSTLERLTTRLPGRSGPPRDVLLALARRAVEAEPSRRPSAAEFASELNRRAVRAHLRGHDHGPSGGATTAGRRRPVRPAAAGLALALVLAVAGAAALTRSRGAPAAPDPPHVPPEVATPLPAMNPAREPAVQVWPSTTTAPSGCPIPGAPTKPDLNGDGCGDALSFHGGILSGAMGLFAVGRPGDLLTAGHWHCSPTATLVLLRPASGEVFVFDGWAAADRDLPGRPVGRVSGAVAIEAADFDGDGCDDIVARGADGAGRMLRWSP